MRLLLDTVTFLWAVDSPDRISRPAMSALQRASAARELSVLSLSEIAIKRAKGKFTISKDDLELAISDLQLHILPYTFEHASRLFDLPVHHGDPFDRQIIAHALAEEIPIVTADETFRLYRGLRVIW